MKILFKYLRLLSLSTSGALLLCIVLPPIQTLPKEQLPAKYSGFISLFYYLPSVCFYGSHYQKSCFTFTLPDGLLLLFTGLILITYDRDLNPQPEKLLFVGQLTMLWFMLRAVIQTHPELRLFSFRSLYRPVFLKLCGEWGRYTATRRKTIRCLMAADWFLIPVRFPVIWLSYSLYA